MIKRLIVGLFLGAVVGVILAAVLVQGLGVMSFDTWALGATGAYLSAAATGLATGLITGKPIWSADGKMEAGLKAFFGALIGLGGMFVLRQWVHLVVDLSSIKASFGPAEIGQLPAVSLPIIAAVLGGFFELDNTEASSAKSDAVTGASPGARVRVTEDEDEASERSEEKSEEKEEAASVKRRR